MTQAYTGGISSQGRWVYGRVCVCVWGGGGPPPSAFETLLVGGSGTWTWYYGGGGVGGGGGGGCMHLAVCILVIKRVSLGTT